MNKLILIVFVITSVDVTIVDAREKRGSAVRRVLEQERDGQNSDRRKSLQRVVESDSKSPAARWNAGYIQSDQEWNKGVWLDGLQPASQNPSLSEYRKMRDQTRQTIDGHLQLANWCRNHNMPDRERAHLTAVLSVVPEHVPTLKRLGYQLRNGVWMPAEKPQELDRNAKRWRDKLLTIRKTFLSGSPQRQSLARRKMLGIKDPDAVPFIEELLVTDDEDLTLTAVECLAGIDSHKSTLSMARLSALSDSFAVRKSATNKLKSRNLDHFVPQMLSALFTAVESELTVVRGARGIRYIEHRVKREGKDRVEVAKFKSVGLKGTYFMGQGKLKLGPRVFKVPSYRDYFGGRGISPPKWFMKELLEVSQSRLDDRLKEQEKAVERQNRITERLNSRIFDVLSAVTDEEFQEDPKECWQWWTNYCEVLPRETKHVIEVSEERVHLTENVTFNMSCLAAGTPIWTENGAVAVEKIRVGDRVLSKNIETGELAYKVVLGTTIRPPVQFIKLTIGDETITTTGGHQYWVSGNGWIRARRLKDGAPLHTLIGTTQVKHDGSGPTARAYNLIVADFHTYFVGESKILSHDVLQAQPTDVLVPGLQRFE